MNMIFQIKLNLMMKDLFNKRICFIMNDNQEKVFKETRLRNLNNRYDKLKNAELTYEALEVKKEIELLEKELGIN